jgi:hypothetical protein
MMVLCRCLRRKSADVQIARCRTHGGSSKDGRSLGGLLLAHRPKCGTKSVAATSGTRESLEFTFTLPTEQQRALNLRVESRLTEHSDENEHS